MAWIVIKMTDMAERRKCTEVVTLSVFCCFQESPMRSHLMEHKCLSWQWCSLKDLFRECLASWSDGQHLSWSIYNKQPFLHFYSSKARPNGHTTLMQRCINVNAMSWRCLDVMCSFGRGMDKLGTFSVFISFTRETLAATSCLLSYTTTLLWKETNSQKKEFPSWGEPKWVGR